MAEAPEHFWANEIEIHADHEGFEIGHLGKECLQSTIADPGAGFAEGEV